MAARFSREETGYSPQVLCLHADQTQMQSSKVCRWWRNSMQNSTIFLFNTDSLNRMLNLAAQAVLCECAHIPLAKRINNRQDRKRPCRIATAWSLEFCISRAWFFQRTRTLLFWKVQPCLKQDLYFFHLWGPKGKFLSNHISHLL